MNAPGAAVSDEQQILAAETHEDLVDLDEALTKLALTDNSAAEIV